MTDRDNEFATAMNGWSPADCEETWESIEHDCAFEALMMSVVVIDRTDLLSEIPDGFVTVDGFSISFAGSSVCALGDTLHGIVFRYRSAAYLAWSSLVTQQLFWLGRDRRSQLSAMDDFELLQAIERARSGPDDWFDDVIARLPQIQERSR